MEHNQSLTKRAQELRRNMTLEERILWYHYLKKYPVPFRRQAVIGNYILDFFTYSVKLAIELDGSQHYQPENSEYEKKRTDYLKSLGITVLRFSNTDIKTNLTGVCQKIDMTIEQIKLRK